MASGKKTSASGNGSPLLAGLLMGLILGLGMAAGLAWYLMRTPSPFVSKEPVVVNKQQAAEQTRAAASEVVRQKLPAAISAVAASAVSGVDDGKPRFEFYKVLTDKQDNATLPTSAGKSNKTDAAKKDLAKTEPAKAETVKAVDKQTYYLQVGAFSNEADAENLKASLTIDGMEVTVLAVDTPSKGMLYKVRTGPYQGADEMHSARAKLQLKGINSTPLHG